MAPMLFTFDADFRGLSPTISDLARNELPDSIEIGENNSHWLMVNRRSKKIELLSKVTGKVETSIALEEARMYGLSERIIHIARTTLKL